MVVVMAVMIVIVMIVMVIVVLIMAPDSVVGDTQGNGDKSSPCRWSLLFFGCLLSLSKPN